MSMNHQVYYGPYIKTPQKEYPEESALVDRVNEALSLVRFEGTTLWIPNVPRETPREFFIGQEQGVIQVDPEEEIRWLIQKFYVELEILGPYLEIRHGVLHWYA